MFKKLLIAIVVLAVIIGGLYLIKTAQGKAAAAMGGYVPQPTAVTTAVVEERNWKPIINAIGSLAAIRGVTVSAEVAGVIDAIHFESGQSVNQGDLLVELDTSSEQAQLKAASAQMSLAKIRLDRAAELRRKNAVAQSELDTAKAQYIETQAQVENLESFIEKKRIRAPFAGRLGLRQADLGQYLNAGTGIVSLQSSNPILLDFSLPQQRISDLKLGMPIEISTDAFPGETFQGSLTAIAPEVSVKTRNLSLQATFDNKEDRLLPGMFARIQVVLDESNPSLILPATAVIFAPYGDSVFIVEERDGGKFAKQVFIRIKTNRGDYVSIESGLKAGDVVVSTGGFKLRNDAPIMEKNDFEPESEVAPKPENS